MRSPTALARAIAAVLMLAGAPAPALAAEAAPAAHRDPWIQWASPQLVFSTPAGEYAPPGAKSDPGLGAHLVAFPPHSACGCS